MLEYNLDFFKSYGKLLRWEKWRFSLVCNAIDFIDWLLNNIDPEVWSKVIAYRDMPMWANMIWQYWRCVCWESFDLLQKRYDNSKHLKKLQVQALFKLPSLAKESPSDLQTLVEGFERIVQCLDKFVKPGDYKDLLSVNTLSTWLDSVTRRGWQELSSTKQQDTVNKLTEYPQRRIGMLESLPGKPFESKNVAQLHQPGKTSFNTMQTCGASCVVCRAYRQLFKCSVFQRMLQSWK